MTLELYFDRISLLLQVLGTFYKTDMNNICICIDWIFLNVLLEKNIQSRVGLFVLKYILKGS